MRDSVPFKRAARGRWAKQSGFGHNGGTPRHRVGGVPGPADSRAALRMQHNGRECACAHGGVVSVLGAVPVATLASPWARERELDDGKKQEVWTPIFVLIDESGSGPCRAEPKTDNPWLWPAYLIARRTNTAPLIIDYPATQAARFTATPTRETCPHGTTQKIRPALESSSIPLFGYCNPKLLYTPHLIIHANNHYLTFQVMEQTHTSVVDNADEPNKDCDCSRLDERSASAELALHVYRGGPRGDYYPLRALPCAEERTPLNTRWRIKIGGQAGGKRLLDENGSLTQHLYPWLLPITSFCSSTIIVQSNPVDIDGQAQPPVKWKHRTDPRDSTLPDLDNHYICEKGQIGCLAFPGLAWWMMGYAQYQYK
ncbi:hypothetical protein B0H15DRAFT_806607 [Mycena belliarum]|uniref:Uncharacterized protein n=1 Tax=Mycena belliarum TaxID=1033014 RepID=A0AAD6TRS6_9AGAR|nr:hypothetical protein B0H15DRAFT_806607 [Mycena belliae]